MYISYDYYRIFYYVAKYGNITQAAKLLLNNQPNLTRSIKNLERAWLSAVPEKPQRNEADTRRRAAVQSYPNCI